MAEFIIKDFSVGYAPSDDAVGGRKNALLRMDNIELDKNGAVSMTGGTKKINSAYSNTLHSIFSRFLTAQQYRYAGDTSGNIFRDNTNIGSGGSTVRTAFCAAYDYVLIFSGNKRVRDDGATATDLGQTASTVPAASLNGAGLLTGSYDYVQVNVYASGAYQAKSSISPLVTIVTALNQVQITAISPTSPANEVWIFRRSTPSVGGDLDQYYRIKRLTSSYTTPFNDNMDDTTALETGVTLSLVSIPVNSTNLADAVLEVVGPVSGRMLLFTKNAVFPTEVNSPESYVPGQGNFFMGSATTAEIFLFARKVGNNVVLIGTTHDIYRCTGSLVSLPDGTIDMSIRGLGVDAPPISIDADIYEGALVYMSSYGWVVCDINGNIAQLTSPNTDRLYRGETCYATGGVPIYILPQLRYSCAVIRNKLYVRVPEIVNNNPATPFTYRCEVYDFVRKYWRVVRFASNNTPIMLFGQEDDAVIGFFDDDKFIKQLDYQFGKTFDNSVSTKQTIALLTTFQDCGSPRNRKDTFTLKLKIYTGGDALTYTIYSNDDQSTVVKTGSITKSSFGEVTIDLADIILKNFQILLSGQIADFNLTDISLAYEPRPEQLTYFLLLRQSLGQLDGRKYRPRVWPLLIDTLGNDFTFTPSIDGSALTPATINTNGKRIFLYHFKTDVFGQDLSFAISGSGNVFELHQVLNPEIVQILPLAKQFDQIGPDELFKYGKIKAVRVRILSESTDVIPYKVYFQDAIDYQDNINVIANVEDTYEFQLPKTVAGQILRVVLGPTSFNFYRYYIQILVTRSGRDTETEWKTLGIPQEQQ